MSERPALRALAERAGILPGYHDVAGRRHETSDATREALLAAMGFDAAEEAGARRALERIDAAATERLLAPVTVWREWRHAAPALRLPPGALGDAREFELELRTEAGEVERVSGALPEPEGADSARRLPLPAALPPGYHEVTLRVWGPSAAREAHQRFVMAPRTAFPPEEALGGERAAGIWANLYSVRGRRDVGHGSFGDLAALARAAGAAGADFVGVNPLHAVGNRGIDFAPYSPISRLYRNLLYLDPESVPELRESPEARDLLEAAPARARRAALAGAEVIDHEGVLRELLPVLAALHGAFVRRHRGRGTQRDADYAAYREREGRALEDFATWEVLAERLAPPGAPPLAAWWTWPEELRDPRSPAVARFRRRESEAVDFRCWLQFELDRQLAEAAEAARSAGCRIGLYQDLAVGSSRASADAWMGAEIFARGVETGAPPDDYAPEGQNWGLPPLDPHRLRAEGYRSWSRLLRAVLAHAGALRVDHAMGLQRLFWIPEGRPGSEGAYVSYPFDDLVGILALESRRQRAVVVVEDLGTVAPELPERFEDWGLLRSAVVHFERETDGSYRPAARYPARALATFATHDLPPFAGLWSGDDLERARRLGRLGSDAELEVAREARAADRRALVEALRAEGLWSQPREPDADEALAAVHAFLARTPSLLVAASLDDLAGEHRPVNVPGVPLARYRSWSRRMARPLHEIVDSERFQRCLAPLVSRSRRDVLSR